MKKKENSNKKPNVSSKSKKSKTDEDAVVEAGLDKDLPPDVLLNPSEDNFDDELDASLDKEYGSDEEGDDSNFPF